MRYVIRQKVFSLGDSFTIQDEQGADVFYVQGKVFSFGNKLSLSDCYGHELIYIKQRLMTFRPTYEIYRGEQLIAVIKKELFTFFNCRFEIETMGYGNIDIEGELLDHEYTFIRGGRTISTVSKEWFTWSDRYGVEINEGENPPFILACVIVIDMICHEDKNH